MAKKTVKLGRKRISYSPWKWGAVPQHPVHRHCSNSPRTSACSSASPAPHSSRRLPPPTEPAPESRPRTPTETPAKIPRKRQAPKRGQRGWWPWSSLLSQGGAAWRRKPPTGQRCHRDGSWSLGCGPDPWRKIEWKKLIKRKSGNILITIYFNFFQQNLRKNIKNHQNNILLYILIIKKKLYIIHKK